MKEVKLFLTAFLTYESAPSTKRQEELLKIQNYTGTLLPYDDNGVNMILKHRA